MPTNNQQHTPEPWVLDGTNRPEIWTADGLHVTDISGAGFSEVNDRIHAARIVACWNACAGINPEAVPLMREALETIDAHPRDDTSPERFWFFVKRTIEKALAAAKERGAE